MLVLKVELWPHGSPGHAREIARAEIVNVGGTDELGDYEATLVDDEGTRRGSVVLRHERAQNVWALICAVLSYARPSHR